MSLSNNVFNNTSVFDYLIKKLESRQKSMHKTRIAMNNIVDLNELKENKLYMNKHFSELEDEINQSIHSFKALLTQNADISEHADSCVKKARINEIKVLSEAKLNNDLKQKLEDLNKEISNLKIIIDDKNSQIVFLNEKITFYDSKLQVKDKEISDIKNENERNKEIIKKLSEEINVLKLEQEADNFNANNVKKPIRIQVVDNLKNILSERESKKKLINEKIRNHLNLDSSRNKNSNSGRKINNNKEIKQYNGNDYPLQMKEGRNNRNNLKKSTNSLSSKISKHDLISDLILKITSSPENIDYLNKKFGNDFMNKIFSPNSDENFLRSLELALEEKISTNRTGYFSNSFKKNPENSSNNNLNRSTSKEIEKHNPMNSKNLLNTHKRNFSLTNKSLTQSQTNLGKGYSKNILCKVVAEKYSPNNFEKNLRSYNPDLIDLFNNKQTTKSSERNKNNENTLPFKKTFDENLKKNENLKNIQSVTEENIKNKNYIFKDNSSHDISFSNKNNNDISKLNDNNVEHDISNPYKKNAGKDKGLNGDEEKLNKDINEIIDENFIGEMENHEKNLSLHSSQNENNDANKKRYNFDSDRNESNQNKKNYINVIE